MDRVPSEMTYVIEDRAGSPIDVAFLDEVDFANDTICMKTTRGCGVTLQRDGCRFRVVSVSPVVPLDLDLIGAMNGGEPVTIAQYNRDGDTVTREIFPQTTPATPPPAPDQAVTVDCGGDTIVIWNPGPEEVIVECKASLAVIKPGASLTLKDRADDAGIT